MNSSSAFKFKSILTDSYRFFFSHTGPISRICLPFLLGLAMFDAWVASVYDEHLSSMISASVFLLVYPLYVGALIQLLYRTTIGERLSSGQLLTYAFGIWPAFLLLLLIMVTLAGLGFLLLVVPGIWVAVRLSLAEFYLVVAGATPIQAIQWSYGATRPLMLTILGSIIGAMLPVLAVVFVVFFLVELLESPLVMELVAAVLAGYMSLVVNVTLFRIFMLYIAIANKAEVGLIQKE